MAILSQIILYPVKSCAGMSVQEATLTHSGLSLDAVYDREWMVVDENGLAMTQREHPRPDHLKTQRSSTRRTHRQRQAEWDSRKSDRMGCGHGNINELTSPRLSRR